MSGTLRCFSIIPSLFKPNLSVRGVKLKRTKIPLPKEIKFQSQADSLSARGFLRSFKPYDPPSDVNERLNTIFAKYELPDKDLTKLDDPAVRFSVLNDCFKEFDHCVPNSILFTIEKIGDISKFYNTPVSTTVPYDEMKNMDLPKNLHVQYDYHRFHPDTDTKFGGVSAFPKRSTTVTGLKYRKKYPGFEAKTSWP